MYNSEKISTYANELEAQKKSSVFFFTSTKKGLGHVSRVTAINEKLNPNFFTAMIGAYESTREYIKNLNPNVDIVPIEYDFSPTSLPENINDEEMYQRFIEQNKDWLYSLTNTSIVITDFVVSSIFLRRFLLEKNLINTLIIGVYHSFQEKNTANDDVISKWQSTVNRVVDFLDICFYIELKAEHALPHITKEGTLIIPIDPVVHERKKTNEQVKAEIGLSDSDEYILIQAGMQGNDSLKQFVESIGVNSPYWFVFLGWDLDESIKDALKDHPRVKVLEKVAIGHELVGAAKGVIAKPGMQTLSEAVVYNVPLLFLPDDHPERKLKIQMLKDIVKDPTIPCVLDDKTIYEHQIREWLKRGDEQVTFFKQIHGDGAQQIASFLQSFHLEGYLAATSDGEKPQPILDTPPGKTSERLSPEDSTKKVKMIRAEIIEKVCIPLSAAGIKKTFILFGGVAKERLRPDSDVDALLVIEEDDLQNLTENWNISLSEPLSLNRIKMLKEGAVDALRLEATISEGMKFNISLMTPTSYKKIFSPDVPYFREELGNKISGTPYYVGDFRGGVHALPKVVERVIGDTTVKERRSPGVIRQENDVTIFGVKHRMLLTADILSDDFNFGDPTRKLIRSIVRAVLYWNNLYIKKDNKIVGIDRKAFDTNFLFRLLGDPLDMIGPKMQRKIKKLYLNELRRLIVIYKRRASIKIKESSI